MRSMIDLRVVRQATLALLVALATGGFAGAFQSEQTDPADRLAWYERHEAMKDASIVKNLAWQFLGPTNISGRITDVAVMEPRGDHYTVFVAGASGGVWRTRNEGVTWEPVFEHAASTSIGDVTISPSNQDIVWIGTGEANIFRSSMAGAGVYKSTDGGDTWEHMGLAGTHTIPRIIVHPSDPDVVYVASSGHEWTDNPDRGVYKTTDGGVTWDKVLFIDDQTGAIDLVMHPDDPDTLYAATWQRIRKKWNDPRNEPDTTGSGIWRTRSGGEDWEPINEGLPEARFRGRIGLDIAASDPDTLYAFIDNYEVARTPDETETDSYGRPLAPVIRGATVFRSDDSGDSWSQASETNAYMERLSATYGWVFGQIRVDPNDPETIYVMGLGLNVSNDGGKTFRRLVGMHGDHHGLWIDPENSSYLVNSNDGGVYFSYDEGENWRSFTHNLPLVQFFNVGYDMDEPFRVYGSIQDHGSYRGVVDLSNGRHRIPPQDWDRAPGGEGSSHAIDPTDPNRVYSAGFYGSISRSELDEGANVRLMPEPPEGEMPYRGQWVAPFIISPHNPRIIYLGLNHLFRSMDIGDSWERISPDLTYNEIDKIGDIPYQTIFSISESPLRFGMIYVGTDDGRVWRTDDAGTEWTEITGALPPGKFIAEIVASAFDEGTVYLAQNGKREDDFRPLLWKSTDYGANWQDMSANIPSGPINTIREAPNNPNVLYTGTDLGVYVSISGGEDWNVVSNRFPTTFVHDLIVHPRDDILVAATHGRGMYALDVRNLQRLTGEVLARPIHAFEPEPVRVQQGRGFGFGRFGGGAPSAQFQYWLSEDAEVQILVKDAEGQQIAELSGTGDAGMNVAEWDLRRAAGDRPQGGGGRFNQGPPFVEPGTYTVEFRAGTEVSETTLEVTN